MIQPEAIQILVGQDGKPKAVQIDVATWRKILEALEDAEDLALARTMLDELDSLGGPEAAGWVNAEELRALWQSDEAL